MANQHTANRLGGFTRALARACFMIAGLVAGIVSGYAQERKISGVITDGGGTSHRGNSRR